LSADRCASELMRMCGERLTCVSARSAAVNKWIVVPDVDYADVDCALLLKWLVCAHLACER
jgi:hypothetical protein